MQSEHTHTSSAFSLALRGHIERQGLSQRDVALRIGVTRQAVSQWLLGHSNPKPSRIPALAAALSLQPVDEFELFLLLAEQREAA